LHAAAASENLFPSEFQTDRIFSTTPVNKETKINLYIAAVVPLGLLALVLSINRIPLENVEIGLIALSIVTVFFSSYLQIQLPRTKIHLTISDALIILTLLIYGGAFAVVLAALESCYTSLILRRKGVSIKYRTIMLNVAVAALSVFAASKIDDLIFGSPLQIVQTGSIAQFVALLVTLSLSLFIVNSVCVSVFIALKSERTVWQVWNEYCLNALVMYVSGAALAGVIVKALNQTDIFLLACVIGFFALVYMTYRRYVDDVKNTAAQAEQAERARAEQAERHIVELQHHIAEQERISRALGESKERFRHAAFHDALTDLPNRNKIVEVLCEMLGKTRREPEYRFAVLFLDLSRFKTVNDSLGHSTGDKLLQNVGSRLKTLLGERDVLARFGGDEFCILLNRIEKTDDALDFARLINEKLTSPFSIGGRQVFINAAIGIAIGDFSCPSAEDVLRDADIAMYNAKEKGKTFEIFNPTMHDRAVRLLQIETDLRYALERREFVAYYQPIVSLETLELVGFETLIRWNHPEKGLVPPGEFIPVSEETGLIVPITYWILEESCRQLVEWQKLQPDGKQLFASVNLSGKHFAHNDLVEQIQNIILKTQIAPTNLKLEITESAVMENAEQTIATLKRLKRLGVRLSIDDFGTGYSSLSYLHRFPVDTLKIDRSFVGAMEDGGGENSAIIRTIVGLAKTLGMDVIAEGIETIHQLRHLQFLGCEYGQGYLISRPVPADKIERFITEEVLLEDILPHLRVAPLELAGSEVKIIG
jgi:diguanylate cyclase (GGDEF)-like protein